MFALVLLAWINDNTKYRVHGVLNINDQTSSNYLDKFLLDLMHARDAPEGGPRGSAGGSGNCDNFTGKSRKIRQRFRGSPLSLSSSNVPCADNDLVLDSDPVELVLFITLL